MQSRKGSEFPELTAQNFGNPHPSWLRVAEDDCNVYVQLEKEDKFYQLPVIVKQTKSIANNSGIAAVVDVYADTVHQHLIYKNLNVMAAANSPISSQLHSDWSTYLLGFFSVNLAKAMALASGHRGRANATQAKLEFFTFGVLLQNAVSQSTITIRHSIPIPSATWFIPSCWHPS